MNKKTIVGGISALAIAGVLFGAGLTSTAQAATPTTPTAASDVTPQYSKRFQLTNGLEGVTLKLVKVDGPNEGRPPIGSTVTYGQLQNFEVQYIAAGTGQVAATYQVHVDGVGNVGEIQIHMVLTWLGQTHSALTYNGTEIPMHLGGSSTDAIFQTG